MNVSVDRTTTDALQVAENKSGYIRYCVNASTYSRRIRFHELETTVNSDCHVFRTAMQSEWVPCDSQNNAILSTSFYFSYNYSGKGFRFRISIDGRASSSIEIPANNAWGSSNIYTNSDFKENAEIFPNQDSYIIELQIRPLNSSSIVAVKKINIILDVMDGMPALKE